MDFADLRFHAVAMIKNKLTPHGKLLENARGKVSKRAASRLAGISEGRWRQIVTGVEKKGRGIELPVNPRPETLIAMAAAVGADPVAVLKAARLDPSLAEALPAPTAEDRILWSDLSAQEQRALLRILEALRGTDGAQEPQRGHG